MLKARVAFMLRATFRIRIVGLLVSLGIAGCRHAAPGVSSGATPGVTANPSATARGRTAASAQPDTALPEFLPDSTWWRMSREFSEPGGYFRSENFVSNEMGLQHVIAALKTTTPRGGVYVGVGPEQNFTYLAALEPRIAFIVDIRRQNLVQHLWYKAAFELSPTRAEFLARLFARPMKIPVATASLASSDSLMILLDRTPADSVFLVATLAEVEHQLLVTHGLDIDSLDLATLRYIARVFAANGPGLNYSSGSGPGGSYGGFGRGGGFRRMPSFADIARATDPEGVNLGFLGTEAAYGRVRDMQLRNMVVPVVGNFAGPDALRRVGEWLRSRHARVNVFYTSNVEQYLFQQGDEWSRFYANVGAMPLDSSARFIRSITGGFAMPRSNFLMTQLTSPIQSIVEAAAAGHLGGYMGVISRSTP